jgi:predicted enzyme related to lactoylglutathione lyase
MPRISGKFVWVELNTPNAKAAQGFYGEVLGWKVQSFPMGSTNYDMIDAAGTTIGGYSPQEKGQTQWLSYLSVDDVDESAKKVAAAGGKVIDAPSDIPTVGRFSKVADPQGAVFYLFRSQQEDRPDPAPAPGHFVWNELVTRDAAKAVGFYEKLFGFTHEEMPMPDGGKYYLLKKDGVSRGGVMTGRDKDAPPTWLPYFSVADADATVARSKKLGAKEYMGPTDIPNVGRFAVLGDPQGATFAVIKPKPAS